MLPTLVQYFVHFFIDGLDALAFRQHVSCRDRHPEAAAPEFVGGMPDIGVAVVAQESWRSPAGVRKAENCLVDVASMLEGSAHGLQEIRQLKRHHRHRHRWILRQVRAR